MLGSTAADGHPVVEPFDLPGLFFGDTGPGVEVESNGIVFTVVGAGNKPDHVWWVKDGVLYWVSNTIFADLTREQLLAIAISTVPVPAAS